MLCSLSAFDRDQVTYYTKIPSPNLAAGTHYSHVSYITASVVKHNKNEGVNDDMRYRSSSIEEALYNPELEEHDAGYSRLKYEVL